MLMLNYQCKEIVKIGKYHWTKQYIWCSATISRWKWLPPTTLLRWNTSATITIAICKYSSHKQWSALINWCWFRFGCSSTSFTQEEEQCETSQTGELFNIKNIDGGTVPIYLRAGNRLLFGSGKYFYIEHTVSDERVLQYERELINFVSYCVTDGLHWLPEREYRHCLHMPQLRHPHKGISQSQLKLYMSLEK